MKISRRSKWFFGSLIVTLFVIMLLVTGSSILTIGLGSQTSIPLGTFITWAGMISIPLTIYWGIKELRNPSSKINKVFSMLIRMVIVLGILWVPIAYLLAGNLSFSFSEKESFQGSQEAMKWFWHLSYGIGIGAVTVLIAYWISLLFKK